MADEIRVLYVDDEPGLLEIGKIFLERSGEFSVDLSLSAREALDSSSIPLYDAIISDYQMPETDGISFLKTVRKEYGDIPFILFTGRGREEVVIEAINNGANFYLQKGGEPKAQFAELAHKIRQAIARRRAQVELRTAYDKITATEKELRGQYQELARSEQQIRESEARFREFAELLPQIVFEIDRNFRVTFVNRQGYSQLGYTPEDVARGFVALSIVDPSQHARLIGNAEKIVRREPCEHREYTITRSDGSTFPALVYGDPVCKQGELSGFRGIVIDISDRKQAEDALRESEEKYRTLVEVNQDIIYSIDRDGTILYVGPRTVDQLGFLPDEMVGKNITEFIHPEDLGIIQRHLDENRDTIGSPLPSDQFRIRRKDGTCRWYEDKTINAIDNRNRAVIIGTARDITKRKLAEDAAFESRQMLQTVLDTIPQRVFWKDRNMVFLGCNKSLANDVGYPDPADLVGKTDYDHSSAGIAEHFRADDREVMESGRPKINFEEPQIRPDGSTSWLRTSKVPLRNRDGEIIGVLGTYEDISASRQAHEALFESEERYRDLADSLPQMVFEADLDLKITYANRHALSVLGLTDEDIRQGTNVLSHIDPAKHADVRDSMLKILHGISFEPKEYIGLRKDGSRFPIVIYSSPIYRNKTLDGFRGIVMDISARKKMEEGLRESEEKFRSFVENANEIVFSLNRKGVFTYVSPQWTEILGHDTSEVINQPASGFIHPDNLPGNAEEFRKVIHDGEKVSGFEYRIRHKDGTWRWHSQSATPVRNAAGTIIAYQGICHDVTEHKRSEEALRQANKKLNLLSSITRHDINNQLQALDGFLELLQKKIPDKAYARYFSQINATSWQITSLIKFTGEYEKIGVQVPLWQNIFSLVETAGNDAVHDGVIIRNDLPARTELFADPLIAKVFFNLVDNAIRHGGAISEIRFSWEERTHDRAIVCEDDGAGVAPDEKEKIFDLGFGKNTGFGLAISREILDITGITIRETGTPGEGARFEMMVPNWAYRLTPR
ncbi:PAS domain S-box protein [Methanoregula sp.]|uniref:PAS domain S-box protein n=1 Tax=Methanoregula sp. TaxID=2052170 RepID=UPI0035661D33